MIYTQKKRPEDEAAELYARYADMYRRQGQLAMNDSIGQAASLTGGYGSSYAMAKGRQSYDAYLQRLGAAGLDIYDRRAKALDSAAQAEKEAAENAEKTRQNDYGNLYKLVLSSGYVPTDAELDAAGLSRGAADSLRGAYLSSLTPKTASGSGSTKAAAPAAKAETKQQTKKAETADRYSAVLARLRAMKTAGSSADSIKQQLDTALKAGAITEEQYKYLLGLI